MPGSSLWLVPPPDHPSHDTLSRLIAEILPAKFPSEVGPPFSPHMTLTSNIDPKVYGENPQQWLDAIPWPSSGQVKVRFDAVKTEDVFFRRGYIKAEYNGVKDIAALARARGVEGEDEVGPKTEEWLKWWTAAFGPHVSLIYGSDLVDESTLKEISNVVEEAGVHLGGGGWDGGVVWLVPTDRPIAEWKPIATKTL
ncbi:hypothetical protein SCUP234_08448 [Seiridium cupressi]